MNTKDEAAQRYIDTHSKSQVLGLLLTLFLGPLGLFYSSWVAALILCILSTVFFVLLFVPILCWLISIPISILAVRRHNLKVAATAALHVGQ